MFAVACCLVVGLGLGLDSVWLVNCYAHVCILLSIVIVTLLDDTAYTMQLKLCAPNCSTEEARCHIFTEVADTRVAEKPQLALLYTY